MRRILIALAALLATAVAQAAPTLYISEFTQNPVLVSGLPAAQTPAIVQQTVAVSGTSAQSTAFTNQTRLVRLFANSAMCIIFGSSPTATASNMPLAANQTEYFLVYPGQKVAAISCTP